jgi:hypothetical protein
MGPLAWSSSVASYVSCACLPLMLVACGGPSLVLGGGGDSGCVPGVYSGKYECTTGADAAPQGGTGPLSLKLEGDLGGKTLNIASGTKLSSSVDGIVFSADLSGSLDCTTDRLKGTLQNFVTTAASFTFSLKGNGSISADYDASASPPALVGGVLSTPQLVQSGLPTLAGSCTWTAKLQ